MRRGDLASDPRFETAPLRVQNYQQLHGIIQKWMWTFRDLASLDAQFDEAKIAMGQIRTLKELGETEWAEYWGAVHQVPDRRGGSYTLQGRPWRFSEDVLSPPGIPAFRGEHNVEVFTELGLSSDEIGRSIAAGMLVEHQFLAGTAALVEPSPPAPETQAAG